VSEITATAALDGEVQVAAGARLEATVSARRVVIGGEFEGRITAETLEFAATAAATGSFLADVIVMHEGAYVSGTFNLPAEDAVEPLAPEAEGPAEESQALSDEQAEPACLVAAEPATASIN